MQCWNGSTLETHTRSTGLTGAASLKMDSCVQIKNENVATFRGVVRRRDSLRVVRSRSPVFHFSLYLFPSGSCCCGRGNKEASLSKLQIRARGTRRCSQPFGIRGSCFQFLPELCGRQPRDIVAPGVYE